MKDKSGEQRGMTDQSGDRDFVIHGSAPPLVAHQKSVFLLHLCVLWISVASFTQTEWLLLHL